MREDKSYLMENVEDITIYFAKEFQDSELNGCMEKFLFVNYLTLAIIKPKLKKNGG